MHCSVMCLHRHASSNSFFFRTECQHFHSNLCYFPPDRRFFSLSLLLLFTHWHSYTLFKYVSIGHDSRCRCVLFSRLQYFHLILLSLRAMAFLLCLCIWGMSHILLLLICVLYVLGYYFLRFGCSCGYASYSFFSLSVNMRCIFCYLSIEFFSSSERKWRWPNLLACCSQFTHKSILRIKIIAFIKKWRF